VPNAAIKAHFLDNQQWAVLDFLTGLVRLRPRLTATDVNLRPMLTTTDVGLRGRLTATAVSLRARLTATAVSLREMLTGTKRIRGDDD